MTKTNPVMLELSCGCFQSCYCDETEKMQTHYCYMKHNRMFNIISVKDMN